MKYVNVYEVSKCYGGPEEGGWWYNAGELRESFGPITEVKAEYLATSIREGDKPRWQYQMGFNSTDGCDPDGNGDDSYLMRGGPWGRAKIKVYVQDKPGVKRFPEERPYYE